MACIFTPSDTLVPHYLKVLEAFQNKTDFETPFPDMAAVSKDYLELYLKKVNVFSTFLHDLDFSNEDNPENDFQIRGPFVSFCLTVKGTWSKS